MSILLCMCCIVLVVVSSSGVVVAFFIFCKPFLVFFAVLCTCFFNLFFNHFYHENIYTLRQTLNFDKKAFLMQLFYILFSLRILTVKKNNTGYSVNLSISLALSSNVTVTLLAWLLLGCTSL